MATVIQCDRCKAPIERDMSERVCRTVGLRELYPLRVTIAVAPNPPVDHPGAFPHSPDFCESCVVAIATAALGNARWVPNDPPGPAVSQ